MLRRFFMLTICMCVAPAILFSQVPQQQGTEEAGAGQPDPSVLAKKRLLRSRNDPMALLDAMTEGLNLDESQRLEVDKLLGENRQEIINIRLSFRPEPDSFEKVRGLTDQLRIAQENGDSELVRQLSDQLREIRKERELLMAPMRQKMTDAQKNLHDAIVGILREDQKQGFEEIWTERMDQGANFRGRTRSPQALKAMVDRLPDITSDQKAQIDEQFRSFREAVKNEPGNSPARQQAINHLYDAVNSLLTPDQRETVTKQMAGRTPHPTVEQGQQSAEQQTEKPQP